MFHFPAEDGEMKNLERGGILPGHFINTDLGGSWCPLYFPPQTVNGALEQRNVSQVEIMMAIMEGFLRSWLKPVCFQYMVWSALFYVQAIGTNWTHFSKAIKENVRKTDRRATVCCKTYWMLYSIQLIIYHCRLLMYNCSGQWQVLSMSAKFSQSLPNHVQITFGICCAQISLTRHLLFADE